MITERFKNAVKSVVADGVVSSEERSVLLNLAKEEKINELDAQVYITGEEKKAKDQQEQKSTASNNSIWDTIIATVGTVIVATVPIIIDKIIKKK
ncbi:MAG: hypothetical protein KA289_00725 [Kaistella sp.]|nr:hypothetical protein [Kaistella sp.]